MSNIPDTIESIVSIEWGMFTAVNEGGPRAGCQEDRVSFDGMRKAQFLAWPDNACESYLDDLETASRDGRNLLEEKYIHMMRTTEPAQYKALLERFTAPPETIRLLAGEVSNLMLEQTRILFETYPYVSGHGRPLYSAFDYSGTSVETYQLGELLTYSEKTLTALRDYIITPGSGGAFLARKILENTVSFLGYDSLEAAEAATKQHIDKLGIQVTYGCCAGGECGDE